MCNTDCWYIQGNNKKIRLNITVKMAQKLARHSIPKLTFNFYSKLKLNSLSRVFNSLPELQSSHQEVTPVLQATGTDGKVTNARPMRGPSLTKYTQKGVDRMHEGGKK
jgi:hypothetical protein